jgi:hypothetical protein
MVVDWAVSQCTDWFLLLAEEDVEAMLAIEYVSSSKTKSE